ncbi:hypothetical protein F6455_10685 [Proteobacteria bacterium 005FR1]|nr:hypothetical protein [Proteobacteria bacterium 005FR1]
MKPFPKPFFARLAEALSRPWLAWAWLAVVLACAAGVSASVLRGYSFDTSVLALLPASGKAGENAIDEKLRHRADEQLAALASQRMIFLVSAPDRQQSLATAQSFAQILRDSDLFAEVTSALGRSQVEGFQQAFFPYRYQLLGDEARASLTDHAPEASHPLLQQALARLYSPMASAVGATLLEDPLQLFFEWQLQAAPNTPFAPENGWLSREHGGRSYRLLAVTLSGNPYELSYQAQVTSLLSAAKAGLPPDVEVLSSGLLLHAAYGAEQARSEISTIGLGSMLGISLLLLWCFRRLRSLLLAFLPIACGWLFALAICMLAFPSLHLITLAFGASLIGVAVDYSLHFLCTRELCTRELRTRELYTSEGSEGGVGSAASTSVQNRSTLVHLMPGMLLGLLSSALAYAAQGAAPFPGLRQMALFSVAGLAGAWLTVILWLPHLHRPGQQASATTPLQHLASTLLKCLKTWPNVARPPVAITVALLVVAALWQVSTLQFDDDIRRLQTSPAALLAEDAAVQRLTTAVSPGQYFLVSGHDEEALLQTEAKLGSALKELVAKGALADFQAVSRWVPSLSRQRADHELNAEFVYAGDGLASELAKALGSPQLSVQMRERFAAQPFLPFGVQDWLATAVGRQQSFLWLGEADGSVHSLVLLSGIRDRAVLSELAGLAEAQRSQFANIQFVDKVGEITEVLTVHREQLVMWIAAAYLLVFVVLALRYRWAAWRILAAPAIASLICLAILSAGGFTITIFNLLALLLVLGIGLDAGIFLQESGRGSSAASAYTWAAVTLAACTTLLAFGLLALSETPVLNQFGLTVLFGIVGVWILAPGFVQEGFLQQGFYQQGTVERSQA